MEKDKIKFFEKIYGTIKENRRKHNRILCKGWPCGECLYVGSCRESGKLFKDFESDLRIFERRKKLEKLLDKTSKPV